MYFHILMQIINIDLPPQNVTTKNIGALIAISSMLLYDEDGDNDMS
mgnify:CR=1 FL=1